MKLKSLLKIAGILAVLGASYAIYMFNKPHRDITGESASLEITAQVLVEDYAADETAANTKFIDKVIAVSGTVLEVDGEHVKLEPGVTFSGDFSEAKLQVGNSTTVKGRIVGYDELFEEVSLDNGIISKN